MNSLTARARAALPEAKPAAEPEKTKAEKENTQAHGQRLGFLRSKKVKAALIAVFALLVAAAAAFVVTNDLEGSPDMAADANPASVFSEAH